MQSKPPNCPSSAGPSDDDDDGNGTEMTPSSFLDNVQRCYRQHEKKYRAGSQKTLETLLHTKEYYKSNVEPFGVVVVPHGDADRQTVRPPIFVLPKVWSFVCSLLVPVIGQAIFGGFYIVRTLALGYILQYTMKLTETAAVQWFLATPPPALICLVLLTMVALIVHPDGFTWILLQKSRNGLLLLLESSSTCWAVAVNDYGTIVSSVLALLTFAGLLSLVFVMHRTLSSKTGQHKARQAQSEKQKRKKRKGKPKSRLRTTHYMRSQKDEKLIMDQGVSMEMELPSCSLPPLVEDKPMLDPVCLRTTAPSYDGQELERRVRSESFDSNFEDSSSCETYVSSPSMITTPNRSLTEPLDAQQYDKPMNISRRRFETTKHETRRGQRRKCAVTELKPSGKTQTIIGSSRWDALKPDVNSSERYSPPNRTRRHEGRGKKQHNQRHFPPSLDGTGQHQAAQIPSGLDEVNPIMPASILTLPSFGTVVSSVVEDMPKEHLELGLNAQCASWKVPNSEPSLTPPPGLAPISKAIPFGSSCCNSDGGYSSLPPTVYHEPSYLHIFQPSVQPLFGAIGPTSLHLSGYCPSHMENASYLNDSFEESDRFIGDLVPSAQSDDDKIEAQLQELGGQMVCSVLDF